MSKITEIDTKQLVIRINELCKKKNITINKMLEHCNLSKSVVDNLKRGSIPTIEKLLKIANYFNVSTDYLLGNEQNNKSNTIGYEFGDKEKAVLERLNKIKALSEEDYELAIAQLDLIIKRREDKNNK